MVCRWKCVSMNGIAAILLLPSWRAPSRAAHHNPSAAPQSADATASPTLCVDAVPPMSGVSTERLASTRSIARDDRPPRRRRGRDGRASSRRTRSGRPGWRCSCRRYPAPSRAPARTSTGKRRSGIDVARRRDADRAGDRRAEIGQDVAEEVARHHHVEALRAQHEMRGQDVDMVLRRGDAGVSRPRSP